MARLAGVELQDNWRLEYALTRIKGIGWASSRKILSSLKVEGKKKLSDVTSDELAKIAAKIEESPIEGELVRQVRGNIQRMKTIGAYRGLRHARNLPVRGQRTRRNARTKRGKRKTVGAFKKDLLSKMQTQEKGKE
ncbi:MAG: 30S ribosomal protein S13 [candidate division WWE3 bacterium GW2011_GWB1_42_6]|uniref:Small ribosomal subunit protein uS13 n=1 Tax=candidate division WWE3 bacterium GW2011_GWB1_42_6 TaxID=1619115 RepID=A0A0G1AX05_UNCKA|nr:MAG: 30S ribosomal protein S13 [candidate division WWE3 bacterium GW2011_GWB1_42_6]